MKAWLSLLGLAMRAGKIVSGEQLVIEAIQRKKVHVVILSEDASANTKKKITNTCTHYDVPIRIKANRHTLGNAIGKAERVVIGVLDEGFSKRLTELMDQ